MFEAHRTNYNTVRATALDWSMLCPGPMNDAPDGVARRELVVSTDVWPFAAPPMSKVLPHPALLLAFMSAMPRVAIYYEDAAAVIASAPMCPACCCSANTVGLHAIR